MRAQASGRRKLDNLPLRRRADFPISIGFRFFRRLVIMLPQHGRVRVPHHERELVYIAVRSEPVGGETMPHHVLLPLVKVGDLVDGRPRRC